MMQIAGFLTAHTVAQRAARALRLIALSMVIRACLTSTLFAPSQTVLAEPFFPGATWELKTPGEAGLNAAKLDHWPTDSADAGA